MSADIVVTDDRLRFSLSLADFLRVQGQHVSLTSDSDRNKDKRSEDTIKLINPGFQITYRIIKKDAENGEIYKADVTCLRGDNTSKKIEAGAEFTIYDEQDRYKFKTFESGSYSFRPLQTQVIKNGIKICKHHNLMEKKEFYNSTLQRFSPSERRLINPHYYKADISEEMRELKLGILENLNKEISNFKIY